MNSRSFLRPFLALLACVGVLAFGPVQTARAAAAPAPAAATTGDAAVSAADAQGHSHAHGANHSRTNADATFLEAFGYSYLTAFLFCLSLAVGGLGFVLIHHIFDAGWSASVLRLAEHLACLFRPLTLLLIPLLLLQRVIWPWMLVDPADDHSLHVKAILFNPISFNLILIALFVFWAWMATRFRNLSLAQDKDGKAIWTSKCRFMAGWGIFVYALTLTLGIIILMKSLQWQFFSTIYGVYYWAGSMWLTFATLYGLARYLSTREMRPVIFTRQIHDLAVLFFAFTVFYSYIAFSQYFLIWNAAIPEETFWFVLRETGSWWQLGLLLLFGHFFVPFLTLLRIDSKLSLGIMAPMIVWAWIMHYLDVTFNVMPVLYPDGLHFTLFDPLCWFGMAGLLGWLFWKDYLKYPKWPQKHPRLKEAITHHEIPAPGAAAASHH